MLLEKAESWFKYTKRNEQVIYKRLSYIFYIFVALKTLFINSG